MGERKRKIERQVIRLRSRDEYIGTVETPDEDSAAKAAVSGWIPCKPRVFCCGGTNRPCPGTTPLHSIGGDGRSPFFVKRLEDGTVINTICETIEDVFHKVNVLRTVGHFEVWIEDDDGFGINEKTQHNAPKPKLV